MVEEDFLVRRNEEFLINESLQTGFRDPVPFIFNRFFDLIGNALGMHRRHMGDEEIGKIWVRRSFWFCVPNEVTGSKRGWASRFGKIN